MHTSTATTKGATPMVHSTTTRAVGPSSPGASAGFEVACTCGFTFRTAVHDLASCRTVCHDVLCSKKSSRDHCPRMVSDADVQRNPQRFRDTRMTTR